MLKCESCVMLLTGWEGLRHAMRINWGAESCVSAGAVMGATRRCSGAQSSTVILRHRRQSLVNLGMFSSCHFSI